MSDLSVIMHIIHTSDIFCIGETADTLNALKYCKRRGALCVGITNTGKSCVCLYVFMYVCALCVVLHTYQSRASNGTFLAFQSHTHH